MPCCAVQVCRNRSGEINVKTCGVAYHSFPKDPTLKEKWIEACGRKEDWFPTRLASICSLHFEEKWYQPHTKCKRLFKGAVPTLKLRMVFETPSTTSKNVKKRKKSIINPGQKMSILERYKVQIEKYKTALRQKNKQIRNYQHMVKRHRKKYEQIKNILIALKDENAVSEDHLWLLESDGEAFFITEK